MSLVSNLVIMSKVAPSIGDDDDDEGGINGGGDGGIFFCFFFRKTCSNVVA